MSKRGLGGFRHSEIIRWLSVNQQNQNVGFYCIQPNPGFCVCLPLSEVGQRLLLPDICACLSSPISPRPATKLSPLPILPKPIYALIYTNNIERYLNIQIPKDTPTLMATINLAFFDRFPIKNSNNIGMGNPANSR